MSLRVRQGVQRELYNATEWRLPCLGDATDGGGDDQEAHGRGLHDGAAECLRQAGVDEDIALHLDASVRELTSLAGADTNGGHCARTRSLCDAGPGCRRGLRSVFERVKHTPLEA